MEKLRLQKTYLTICFIQLKRVFCQTLDTIKMIAYRAETAMVSITREEMAREDDGRALLRSLYQTEVDLMPDEKNKTLTVKLHHSANHCFDKTIQHLCNELNKTDTLFPGTNLSLIYKLGTS